MDDLQLIPRTVRDKLDRIGVKLHLRDWQQLALVERRELHDLPCVTPADQAHFQATLTRIVERIGGELEAAAPGTGGKRNDPERHEEARPMTGFAASMLVLSLVAAGEADEIVRWQDAGSYIGDERWVEGTVVAVRREANVIRLVFDEQPRTFTAALIVGWLSRFPADPERAYVGRTIRVFGRVRQFRDVPEILVLDPARVVVVEPDGTATPDDGSAREPTPIATVHEPTPIAGVYQPTPIGSAGEPTPGDDGRLQRLEERLERMEQRMEELLRPTPP